MALEPGGEHRLQQGVVLGADLLLPLGPSKLQPSSALAMAAVSVALPDSIAWTIIWAAVKPSGLNRSGCRPPS